MLNTVQQIRPPADIGEVALYVFIASVGFTLLSLIISARRPVTGEAEIGDYSFYAVDSKAEFAGITSLAKDMVNTHLFQQLSSLEIFKEAAGLGGVSKVMSSLQFYGVRNSETRKRLARNWGKIIVASVQDLTDPKWFQQTERRWRWIPPGFAPQRRVISQLTWDAGTVGGWQVFFMDVAPARAEESSAAPEIKQFVKTVNPADFSTIAVLLRGVSAKAREAEVYKTLWKDTEKETKKLKMELREERNMRDAAEQFASRTPLEGGQASVQSFITKPGDLLKGMGMALAGAAVGGTVLPKVSKEVDVLTGTILGIGLVAVVFWWVAHR